MEGTDGMELVTEAFNQLREVRFHNPVLLFLDFCPMLVVRPLVSIENEDDRDWIAKEMGEVEKKHSELWVFSGLCVKATYIEHSLAFYNPDTVQQINHLKKPNKHREFTLHQFPPPKFEFCGSSIENLLGLTISGGKPNVLKVLSATKRGHQSSIDVQHDSNYLPKITNSHRCQSR